MQPYQTDFIDTALANKALKFGEFQLKSGRISPYFFNAGEISSGAGLATLGACYAAAISQAELDFDMLFGPAYKGITLGAATAMGLATNYQRDVSFAFNRKEAKDHGEGGSIVGGPLQGRVLIVDDVITAGTAIRQSIDIIAAAGAQPVGVVIGLDRQERGEGGKSAVQEVKSRYGIEVISIVGLEHIVDFLRTDGKDIELVQRIEAYRTSYGVTED